MEAHHKVNANNKADRAMAAIELVAATMVGTDGGGWFDRTTALEYIQLHLSHPAHMAAADMWAMIGLAAGHLEGVTIHGVEEVDRLPTYKTSAPLIMERLNLLINPVPEFTGDPFEGLMG
jgi:hypothetical protein